MLQWYDKCIISSTQPFTVMLPCLWSVDLDMPKKVEMLLRNLRAYWSIINTWAELTMGTSFCPATVSHINGEVVKEGLFLFV